jgi:hypothetical protein
MKKTQTPLPIIAEVSRIVTKTVDRITGDRADYPLLVAKATVEAIQRYGISAQLIYGQAAWLEVLEDHSLIWAGCWGENLTFWAATEYGEVVDLNVSVAHRKRSHDPDIPKPLYSPPIVWSKEVPRFYRYAPEGVAEIELQEERDLKWLKVILEEIESKCSLEKLPLSENDLDFPNEPIICPDRKILDNTSEDFKHFDRILSIKGIPEGPF